jgi:hypothetical protein
MWSEHAHLLWYSDSKYRSSARHKVCQVLPWKQRMSPWFPFQPFGIPRHFRLKWRGYFQIVSLEKLRVVSRPFNVIRLEFNLVPCILGHSWERNCWITCDPGIKIDQKCFPNFRYKTGNSTIRTLRMKRVFSLLVPVSSDNLSN